MSGFSNLFAQQQQGPKPALTFRAGKMNKQGTTVRADARKGRVQLVGDQGFIHFQWVDRVTNQLELDLLVFPEEAKYFKVDKCTTGRVYILKFQQGQSSREFFFWLQEPSTDNDEKYCKMINDFIAHPMSCRAGAGAAGDSTGPMMVDEHQQDPHSFTPSQTEGGGRDIVPPQGTQGGNIDFNTLEAILGGMGGSRQQQQQQQQQQQAVETSLNDVFSQQEVRTLLSAPDASSFEERLREHYPEGLETDIVTEIRSPQFRQTLDILQAAMADPTAREELITAFGIPKTADTGRGGVDQFLRSIIEWQGKQKEKEKDSSQ